MLEFANGSISIIIQLNRTKQYPIGPRGKEIKLADEEILDKILSKTDDLVPAAGQLIAAKRIIPQRMMYQNPYILIVAKVVDNETADMIRNYNEMTWNEKIEFMKEYIENRNPQTQPPVETEK